MIKKIHIIAATDYSLAATNACRYAIKLAKHLSGVVTFIHVYKYPAVMPDSLSERDKIKKYLSDIESKKIEEYRLEILAKMKIRTDEIETNGFAYEGDITNEILDEAKRSEADFIITGTHGPAGFRKRFIGNHTWEIIRKSPVPVFAVPQDSSFNGFKNIVFGTEYNQDEIPVIKFLSHLAGLSEGHLTILHVSEKRLSANGELKIAQDFQKDVIDKSGLHNFDLTIIQNDEIAEGLDKFCVEKNADCIILSNNKSLRIENILPPLLRKTKKLSTISQVPLLVIPAYYSILQKKFWELSGLEYYFR